MLENVIHYRDPLAEEKGLCDAGYEWPAHVQMTVKKNEVTCPVCATMIAEDDSIHDDHPADRHVDDATLAAAEAELLAPPGSPSPILDAALQHVEDLRREANADEQPTRTESTAGETPIADSIPQPPLFQ